MERTTALAALALTAALTACGGDGKPAPAPLPPGATPMPDVEGLRLDAARSDLEKAGLDRSRVEVVGGGALGVVNESNWWVCDQEPDAGEAVGSKARVLVDREGRCNGRDRLK
ncbi:MAG TPA: PASTA domain-containing protein [Frankiaceae bacterium]|jgi:hypothetical protein|nr:PASTA domain-containing protein [Frankiaceae bacterium]